MGIVKLWPLAVPPVNGKVNLDVPAFNANLTEASTTFNIATPISLTLPHDVDHVTVEVPFNALDIFELKDMIFSALDSSNRFYGHNKTQVPGAMAGEEYPPDGYSMQTRYGGEWVLPPGGQPGDKIYINVGSFSGFYAMAIITLT